VRQLSRRISQSVSGKSRRGARGVRPSSFRPSLEALEVRALMSVTPVIGDVF
jgi:hypothetical protein